MSRRAEWVRCKEPCAYNEIPNTPPKLCDVFGCEQVHTHYRAVGRNQHIWEVRCDEHATDHLPRQRRGRCVRCSAPAGEGHSLCANCRST